MKELISLIVKVKTFIGLSALIYVILYLIFKQILSLDIFTTLESKETFSILYSVIDKIFIIAIITIIVTAIMYIISKYFPNNKTVSKKPKIEVVSVTVEKNNNAK